MNIMQLVEGKKYKDQWGEEWHLNPPGYIVNKRLRELNDSYTSKEVRSMVFTEVKEPLTITLEAEELEFIKNLLDGTCIIPYDSGMKIGEKLLEKLNGVAFETYELK